MQEVINFATVLAVAVGVASCIGVMYASGLRLWAKGVASESEGRASHITSRVASVVCFAACVVVVLFALWLMIPYFHQG